MATCAASPVSKVYDSAEELDLVRRARQGDQSAFTVLDTRYRSRVIITITKRLKDEDTAEWVANHVMTKAWTKLHQFRENSKFSTWLTRIAINEAKMHLRKERKHHCDVSLDTLLSAPEGAGRDSNLDGAYVQKWLAIKDAELEGIPSRELLGRAFEGIPEQFKEILRLRLWEDMSLEEIRDRLGASQPELLSIPAVKSRILRGRILLREQVALLS